MSDKWIISKPFVLYGKQMYNVTFKNVVDPLVSIHFAVLTRPRTS